jgi:hypothetical protein
MRKMIEAAPRGVAAAFATALLAASALGGIAPAAAGPAFAAQDRVIAAFCNGHPQAYECDDWRYNRERWSNNQYQAFYREHRGENGFNTAEAAADFGLMGEPGPTLRYVVVPAESAPAPEPLVRYVVVPNQAAPSPAPPVRYVVVPAATGPSVYAVDPGWQVGVQTGNVEGNRAEVIGDSDDHVGDCLATFKSYDVQTDSYFAFDGTRHRCKL